MRLPFLRKRQIARNVAKVLEDDRPQRPQQTYDEENDDIYYGSRSRRMRMTETFPKKSQDQIRIKRNKVPADGGGGGGPGGKTEPYWIDLVQKIHGEHKTGGAGPKTGGGGHKTGGGGPKTGGGGPKPGGGGPKTGGGGHDVLEEDDDDVYEGNEDKDPNPNHDWPPEGNNGDDFSDEGGVPVQFNNLPRSATVGPVIPTNLVPITGGPLNSHTTSLPLFWVPFASFGGILLLVLLLVCLYCVCFKKKKAGGLTPDNSSSTSVGLKNQMLTVEMPSSKNQDVTVQKVNGENVMVIKECNPNSSEPTVTTISESAPDSKGIVNVTIVKETMVKVPHKEPGGVEGSKSNLGQPLPRPSQLSNTRSKMAKSKVGGSKSRL